MDGREEIFVGGDESTLCTLEASVTPGREESFNFVQGLPLNVITALRALSKDFSEYIRSVVLSPQLCTMVAKSEQEWSMRFYRRPAGLLTRFNLYREQEDGEAANHFKVEAAAEKGRSSSELCSNSYPDTVYGPHRITRGCQDSSSVSLETSVAALLKAPKPYLGLQNCRSSHLVRSSSFDDSAPVLDATFQLFLTDRPYSLRRLKKSKDSAHDNFSVKDMKNTVKSIAYMLRPGALAILLCRAQEFAVWHTVFCAQKST